MFPISGDITEKCRRRSSANVPDDWEHAGSIQEVRRREDKTHISIVYKSWDIVEKCSRRLTPLYPTIGNKLGSMQTRILKTIV